MRSLIYGNWFTIKIDIQLKQTEIKIENVLIYNNLKPDDLTNMHCLLSLCERAPDCGFVQ